jgi:hypothetical protein
VTRSRPNKAVDVMVNQPSRYRSSRNEQNRFVFFPLRSGWFGYRPLNSVAKGLIDFAARPKPMQQDGKFSRHCDACSFLGVLSATLAEFHSESS